MTNRTPKPSRWPRVRPNGLPLRVLVAACAAVAIMLAAALAALLSTGGSASASFIENVETLAAATESALADGELSDAERDELSDLIAALTEALDGDAEALAALERSDLDAAAALIESVRDALQDHYGDDHEADLGYVAGALAAAVAEAVVADAAEICGEANDRETVEDCRRAFHEGADACAALGEDFADCKSELEQLKDAAEERYETLKQQAGYAAGCEDLAEYGDGFTAACAEIASDVEAACADGEDFAGCLEAFHEGKQACEALGEFGYEGCKYAIEAIKDAADPHGYEDGEDGVELVEDCSELTDGELAASCQWVIDGVAAACSDVRSDEDRDACQRAFHEWKQACEALGMVAYEACKDEIEEIKDTAEHEWEALKQQAEHAANCGEVAALDGDAGAECAAVTSAYATACSTDADACREYFHTGKAECEALGVLAAEGCKSELEGAKEAAEAEAEALKDAAEEEEEEDDD